MRTDLIVAGGLAALVLGIVSATRRSPSTGPNLVQLSSEPIWLGRPNATLATRSRYRGRLDLPMVAAGDLNPWSAGLQRVTATTARGDLAKALAHVATGGGDWPLGFRDVQVYMSADEARATGLFPPDAFTAATDSSRWFEGVWDAGEGGSPRSPTTRVATSPIVAIWTA